MTKFFLLSPLAFIDACHDAYYANLPTWLALTVSQTVGCFIFWYVDKFIFTK